MEIGRDQPSEWPSWMLQSACKYRRFRHTTQMRTMQLKQPIHYALNYYT